MDSRRKGIVFVLSPADCRGVRATRVLAPRSQTDLAVRLRSRRGVPLGDVFSSLSRLYFRGKLAYARRYAVPPEPRGGGVSGSGIHIITPTAGLMGPDVAVRLPLLRAFANGDVSLASAAYRRPLENSVRALAREVGSACEVVLLGSIASPKYVELLLAIFQEQLRFPVEFVGRGDLSRGGLLLRHAVQGKELEYGPVAGSVLRGPRPVKLTPLPSPHT